MKKRTSRGVYRKLASFLKPYLPLILLALLFSTIQIAATLLSPVVVGKTIDYIVGEGNVDFGLIARNAIVLAALNSMIQVRQTCCEPTYTVGPR